MAADGSVQPEGHPPTQHSALVCVVLEVTPRWHTTEGCRKRQTAEGFNRAQAWLSQKCNRKREDHWVRNSQPACTFALGSL